MNLPSALILALLGAALAPPAAAEPFQAAADGTVRVQGTIRDAQGDPVRGASVVIEGNGQTRRATTDDQGRFELEWPGPRSVVVTVAAPGQREVRRGAILGRGAVDVTLGSSSFEDRITVTASGRVESLGETAASVMVLTASDLRTTAGLTLDDALRQVPGFALFRRTSSRGANPTTQGATLRGLAGSGASRALVLEDGVPLNDPFGGWVYWGRVPRAAVDRLEVLRGGGSDLYGSSALAGVVQVMRAGTETPRVEAELLGGQQDLAEGSFFAGGRRGGWGARVAAEVLSTSGYFPVPRSVRGAVDRRLDTRHHGGDVAVERALGEGRLFVRGGGYRERRGNGTEAQENETEIDQAIAGLDLPLGTGGLRVRGDLSRQEYRQTFSVVALDRRTERLSSFQFVPARTSGVSAQWTRPLGSHVLLLGAERRAVWGRSDEETFGATTSVPATSGGRQRTTALFVEDAWRIGERLVLTGGVRLDRWRNIPGQQTADPTLRLTERTESAVSPRGSVLLKLARRLSVTASAYRAFRAPSLNELYRPFRVGNVVTLPNAELEAEKARGVEAGALIGLGALSVRATAFRMTAEDTVANVTVSSTPGLITRQRRNLGAIRSRGVEVDVEARLGRRLILAASTALIDAKVRDAADPNLVGRRVAQVPRRQGGAQLRYEDPDGWTLGIQARFSSLQFEDDLNSLRLAGYWTVDALAGHALNEWVTLFAAAENLANEPYEVGRTPIPTVGPPRTVRGGLRVRLGGGRATH